MESIHYKLLRQFKAIGFSIESGMAVNTRLVKSASCPVSGERLKGFRKKRAIEEKAGKSVKFCRDVDSGWTIKNDESVFGMKKHASIDVRSGLVLASLVSKACEHDTNYFQAVVVKGLHGGVETFLQKCTHGRGVLWRV